MLCTFSSSNINKATTLREAGWKCWRPTKFFKQTFDRLYVYRNLLAGKLFFYFFADLTTFLLLFLPCSLSACCLHQQLSGPTAADNRAGQSAALCQCLRTIDANKIIKKSQSESIKKYNKEHLKWDFFYVQLLVQLLKGVEFYPYRPIEMWHS